ncbi:hypothetical protein JW905_07460 [bacterium]|nr:hypothetical protein [candidate division CSSED10-310 bacterium]
MTGLHGLFEIPPEKLDAINRYLDDPGNALTRGMMAVIDKYGGVAEIERKAAAAGRFENQLAWLKSIDSPWLPELEWLMEQREKQAFIPIDEYRRSILGDKAGRMEFDESYAVTLELSSCQYLEWLFLGCRKAIKERSLVPGRFIRVRNMKEQDGPDGEVLAFAAAMNIIGSSWVETLDTKGTDGSNVHLGGPATITGYFGGVGEPNHYPFKWLEEFLYYYTKYGVREVLNVNPGTILLGYLMRKMGIGIQFKISVYMGNDNPFAAFWTLLGAKLFSGPDNDTSLIGFNFSNSVNNETIEISAEIRSALGFTDHVRFEHHITETYKSIVRQPYNRRDELLEIADHVKNISAKHEGGDLEVEERREHPSDILDYFRAKQDIIDAGEFEYVTRNYLDKWDAVNLTARKLTERGLTFKAAARLHA